MEIEPSAALAIWQSPEDLEKFKEITKDNL